MESRVIGIKRAIEAALKAAEEVQDEIAKSYGRQWQKDNGPTIATIKDGMLFLHREWHELLNRVKKRYELKSIINAMDELAGAVLKVSADLTRLMQQATANNTLSKFEDGLDDDEFDF